MKHNSNLFLDRHPLNSMFKYFYFGHCFEIDEDTFREKHNELQGFMGKAIANVCMSWQGNGEKAQAGEIVMIRLTALTLPLEKVCPKNVF